MTLTFLDAGVLIAAARAEGELAMRSLAILDDPKRAFASSSLVKLEVLPKAVYHQNSAEVEFYEIYFNSVQRWADISESLAQKAYEEACRTGLGAVDALHVAAAVAIDAREFITTEKLTKPIHRTRKIKVISIALE